MNLTPFPNDLTAFPATEQYATIPEEFWDEEPAGSLSC